MNGLKANLSYGFYIETKDVIAAGLIEQKRIEFNHGAFKMKDDNNADKDVYVFNITLSGLCNFISNKLKIESENVGVTLPAYRI